VPRYDERNKISKCHLCFDRIADGLQPACTKICPTGSLKYGDREALIRGAQKAGYARLYGQNDLGGLGALYAFRDAPTLYGYNENPLIHYLVIGPHEELGEKEQKDG
jgi:formate dehydrogenase iron-sulfur subunit